MATFPLTNALQESDQQGTEIRTEVARFGDGYRQECEDGLNAEKSDDGWVFFGTHAEIRTAIAFLETNGAEGFEYTPALALDPVTYTCVRWRPLWFAEDRAKLVCDFEQFFDL